MQYWIGKILPLTVKAFHDQVNIQIRSRQGKWTTDVPTLRYYYRFFVASGRISASEGIPTSRYKSVLDLTHLTQPTGQTTTPGDSPISSRTVCGFFNIPRRALKVCVPAVLKTLKVLVREDFQSTICRCNYKGLLSFLPHGSPMTKPIESLVCGGKSSQTSWEN